jgi:hypothetical protein
MASLEPKLFCGVALLDEKEYLSRGQALDGRKLTETLAIYATIIVNRPIADGRATPPHRQNLPDVALLASDYLSETADYTDGA